MRRGPGRTAGEWQRCDLSRGAWALVFVFLVTPPNCFEFTLRWETKKRTFFYVIKNVAEFPLKN